MTVEDLILVSEDGKVLEGGRPGRNIVNLAGFTCVLMPIDDPAPSI